MAASLLPAGERSSEHTRLRGRDQLNRKESFNVLTLICHHENELSLRSRDSPSCSLICCAQEDALHGSTDTPSVTEEKVASTAGVNSEEEKSHKRNHYVTKVQGAWPSNDDPKAVIEGTGAEFADWSEGEWLDTGTMAFGKGCEEQVEDSAGEYFTTSGEGHDLCYFLLHAI